MGFFFAATNWHEATNPPEIYTELRLLLLQHRPAQLQLLLCDKPQCDPHRKEIDSYSWAACRCSPPRGKKTKENSKLLQSDLFLSSEMTLKIHDPHIRLEL